MFAKCAAVKSDIQLVVACATFLKPAKKTRSGHFSQINPADGLPSPVPTRPAELNVFKPILQCSRWEDIPAGAIRNEMWPEKSFTINAL